MSGSKKILIIEDDQFTREVYEEVLKDEGFEVTLASDGQQGLDKAKEGDYTLILLDVMMPKMNGLEVLEHLQKDPPTKKNGPIILLTNLAHDPIIKDALSKGAKSYLIKSDLTPDQLVEKLKKFLD